MVTDTAYTTAFWYHHDGEIVAVIIYELIVREYSKLDDILTRNIQKGYQRLKVKYLIVKVTRYGRHRIGFLRSNTVFYSYSCQIEFIMTHEAIQWNWSIVVVFHCTLLQLTDVWWYWTAPLSRREHKLSVVVVIYDDSKPFPNVGLIAYFTSSLK